MAKIPKREWTELRAELANLEPVIGSLGALGDDNVDSIAQLVDDRVCREIDATFKRICAFSEVDETFGKIEAHDFRNAANIVIHNAGFLRDYLPPQEQVQAFCKRFGQESNATLCEALTLFCSGDDAKIPSELASEYGISEEAILNLKNEIVFLREEARDDIKALVNSFRTAVAAIGSMRFLVEGEKLQAAEVDLGAFLRDAASSVECEQGTSINISVQEGLRSSFDPETLHILLVNMVKNAVIHGDASQIEANVSAVNGCILIEVTDNGSGIPEGIADRVFEDGYTSGNGTGTGLASARERLAQFGANIRCEGNGGISGGAKFTISLPRVSN